MGKKNKKKDDKPKWKKHFRGQGDSLIHTDRQPICWQGKEVCEYQNTARKGPVARYKKPQDHHIVPVSAMIRHQNTKEQGYDKDAIDLIDDAYRDQEYCANNAKNLWWLPTKPTYLGQQKRSLVWDLNLPCHTIGHAAYFKEVVTDLKNLIWDPLTEKKEPGEPCPPPDVVTIVFTELEKAFRRRLTNRGKRPGATGGTRYAIDHQGQGDDWWHAFSMADTPDCTDAVETFITTEIPAALKRK